MLLLAYTLWSDMPSTHKTDKHVEGDVFTAIANPVRRQILTSLAHRNLTVTDIAEPFHVSRSAISQHLTVLLDSGLVAVQKQGREHVYRIRTEALDEVYQWMKQFEHFWLGRLDALEAYLDEEYPPDESEPQI
jgi:DNA-binding transcriptional ArsR family regulator